MSNPECEWEGEESIALCGDAIRAGGGVAEARTPTRALRCRATGARRADVGAWCRDFALRLVCGVGGVISICLGGAGVATQLPG